VIGGPQKVPVGWRYQSEVLLAHVQEYAVVGHQDEEWVQYGQHDEEQHHTAVHELYDHIRVLFYRSIPFLIKISYISKQSVKNAGLDPTIQIYFKLPQTEWSKVKNPIGAVLFPFL